MKAYTTEQLISLYFKMKKRLTESSIHYSYKKKFGLRIHNLQQLLYGKQ